jgi:hypothetical protein
MKFWNGLNCPQIAPNGDTDYARPDLLIRRTFPQVRAAQKSRASIISVISGPLKQKKAERANPAPPLFP